MLFRCFILGIVFTLLLVAIPSLAQETQGLKGRGVYKLYDKSFISPEVRRKHTISIGVQNCFTSPLMNIESPNIGFHLGYNYFLLKGKTRVLSAKKKKRDEVKIGFGAHFSMYQNSEWFTTVIVYRPVFALKGNLLSFFLLNELGLGVQNTVKTFLDGRSSISPVVTIEVMRLRFGRSFTIFGGLGYASRNELFSKQPKEISLLFGTRLYFYKKKA